MHEVEVLPPPALTDAQIAALIEESKQRVGAAAVKQEEPDEEIELAAEPHDGVEFVVESRPLDPAAGVECDSKPEKKKKKREPTKAQRSLSRQRDVWSPEKENSATPVKRRLNWLHTLSYRQLVGFSAAFWGLLGGIAGAHHGHTLHRFLQTQRV